MERTFNKETKKAYFEAKRKGIVEDNILEIIRIIDSQEIVSYCITFDYTDLEIDYKAQAFTELEQAFEKWERHLQVNFNSIISLR